MTPVNEQTNNPHPPDPALVEQMRERLAELHERMAQAAERVSRSADSISLVAISKTHPPEMIEAALAAGQELFGENRVQEALPKLESLGGRVRWHLVGHLQSNKARQVVGRFEMIHSVDSVHLIEALEQEAARAGCVQRVLLQINVSGEASKFGAPPSQLPELLEALARSPHVKGEGLMTIPPFDLDAEEARPHFRELRRLLDSVGPQANFSPTHLSMGMSGDFEVAIEEGATLVRVGTALFGARPA